MDLAGSHIAPDGSLIASDGRVIVFSRERFERDVCRAECCFVCGAAPGTKPFNDEHILARWLLRRHDLFAREITLPNGQSYRYDRYKIPCCEECNTFLGKNVEEPVRALFDGGHRAISEHIRANGPDLLYRWLALIYIKTHLRDATFPWNRDRRNDIGTIGDVYDWDALHHIHAVARSLREGITLGPNVVGTIVALPALMTRDDEAFDFGDMYAARAILVRSGETALIAVLNDGRAAEILQGHNLSKITAALTTPQLREILSSFAYTNLHLRSRPKFSTVHKNDSLEIVAELPSSRQIEVDEEAEPSVGKIMSYVCGPFLEAFPSERRAEIQQAMAEGRWSWMFDGEGKFIENASDE